MSDARDAVLRDVERGVRKRMLHVMVRSTTTEDIERAVELTARTLVAAARCEVCKGTGEAYERHDYATETLACQDCRGTGVDPTRLDAALREGERE